MGEEKKLYDALLDPDAVDEHVALLSSENPSKKNPYASLRGIRTIHNGSVTFFGTVYVPKDPYHGELDGQKWYFISYAPKHDLLAMWGSEEAYRASVGSEEQYKEFYKTRREANVDADGFTHWYFWEKKP